MLRRLQRIEALELEGADPRALLAEVEALLDEASAWLEAEGGPEPDAAAAAAAVARCRAAVSREEAGMLAM